MRKIRIQNVQRAQGMVEFALVLPVLLLVILGVFAFGHMFFAYSSIVSASREATRWGSAVGTASTDAGALPRYQDCAAIKAAAVRIGSIAGVQPNSVVIGYDNGPGSAVYGNCPKQNGGTSGPDVSLGDRIIVTVSINYKPIVPVLDLPSFTMTAQSARTIIKSLPVGDAPTAVPLWPSTLTTIVSNIAPDAGDGKIHIVIGQTVTLTVKVADDSGASPTGGEVTVNDNNSVSCTPATLAPDKNGKNCTFRFATIGERTVTARYDQLTAKYMPSQATATIVVDKADTSVVIDGPAQWQGNSPTQISIVAGSPVPLTLSFHVVADLPSEASPPIPLDAVGHININGSTYLNVAYTASQVLSRSISPPPGEYEVVVYYDGNDQFNKSESAVLRLFVAQPTPEPTSVNTSVAPPTSVPPTSVPPTSVVPATATPAPTALPKQCPKPGSSLNFGTASSIIFDIDNPDQKNNGGSDRTIDRIDVAWPSNYNAKLNQVIFGSNVSACNTGSNCLLTGLNLPPTYTSITNGFAPSANSLPSQNNQTVTRTMRLVFSGPLPTGPYDIIVHFSGGDNCQLEIAVNR